MGCDFGTKQPRGGSVLSSRGLSKENPIRTFAKCLKTAPTASEKPSLHPRASQRDVAKSHRIRPKEARPWALTKTRASTPPRSTRLAQPATDRLVQDKAWMAGQARRECSRRTPAIRFRLRSRPFAYLPVQIRAISISLSGLSGSDNESWVSSPFSEPGLTMKPRFRLSLSFGNA